MAENEKRLAADLARLPGPLQDKFLEQIKGASMALDFMADKTPPDSGGETTTEGG